MILFIYNFNASCNFQFSSFLIVFVLFFSALNPESFVYGVDIHLSDRVSFCFIFQSIIPYLISTILAVIRFKM